MPGGVGPPHRSLCRAPGGSEQTLPRWAALSLVGSPSSPHLGPCDHADFCYLPSVCGNCKALFIRFFYNASSQRCEEFIYGGCGGNRNNFETKRECFQACSHIGNRPHRQSPPRAAGPLLPPRAMLGPAPLLTPRLSAPGAR